jgi:hypothetical protein
MIVTDDLPQPGLQPEALSLYDVPARLEEWDGEHWRLVGTASSTDEVSRFLRNDTAVCGG